MSELRFDRVHVRVWVRVRVRSRAGTRGAPLQHPGRQCDEPYRVEQRSAQRSGLVLSMVRIGELSQGSRIGCTWA